MSSVTLSTSNMNCYSKSGSTQKYESDLGPSISSTSKSGSLVSSVSGTLVKNSTSSTNCNYKVNITINYTIPSGYTETTPSSGATSATIGGTVTTVYAGVSKTQSVSKTVYYEAELTKIYVTISLYQSGSTIYGSHTAKVGSFSSNTYYKDKNWSVSVNIMLAITDITGDEQITYQTCTINGSKTNDYIIYTISSSTLKELSYAVLASASGWKGVSSDSKVKI